MWRSLQRIQSDWNRYAKTDPLWAISTDPSMKNRGWDPDAFFATGRVEVDYLMRYLASLQANMCHGRALDFGCGVGRLTRALASHFDQVCGVDISPVMVNLAREYNAHLPNCTFIEIAAPSFHSLPPGGFDLILSNATLQHMPPRHMKHYLRGMIAHLRPGGLLLVQIPGESRVSHIDRARAFLYEEFYRRYILRREPSMDMYGIPKPRVIAFLERNGCRVLDVVIDSVAGPEWTSFRYAAIRDPENAGKV